MHLTIDFNCSVGMFCK